MTIRWGIVGAGNISLRFIKDLAVLAEHPIGPNKLKHELAAVGASSRERAQAYIDKNHLKATAMNYDEIIASDVDVLYIGLPHNLHAPFVVRAITEGNKNILCEKPVTINQAQLDDILAAAKKHNVFFMEAMWARFFPAFLELQRELYKEKLIGEVRRVHADFSCRMYDWDGLDANHRMVNKKLGGGALLDLGIYPLTYSRLCLHPELDPSKWNVLSQLTMDSLTGAAEDEVDFIASAIFNNTVHKQQAIMTTSVHTNTVHEGSKIIVRIEGDKGRIDVKSAGETPCPASYTVTFYDGRKIERDFTLELNGGEGFFYEAAEVGECLNKGAKESKVFGWDESRKIMGVLDKIRAQNGFKYEDDR